MFAFSFELWFHFCFTYRYFSLSLSSFFFLHSTSQRGPQCPSGSGSFHLSSGNSPHKNAWPRCLQRPQLQKGKRSLTLLGHLPRMPFLPDQPRCIPASRPSPSTASWAGCQTPRDTRSGSSAQVSALHLPACLPVDLNHPRLYFLTCQVGIKVVVPQSTKHSYQKSHSWPYTQEN